MKRFLLPITILIFSFVFSPNIYSQKLKDRLNKLGKKKKVETNSNVYNAEADLMKVGGPFSDIGMTNEIHKKYAGKIVFAKDKIGMDIQNEANFIDTFGVSDYIYGRVYMPKSVENYPIYSIQYLRRNDYSTPYHNEYGGFHYKLYVDGELNLWPVEVVVLSKYKKVNTTTWQVWIHPKASDQKVKDSWKEIIQNLSSGEHTIKLDMIAGTNMSYTGAEVVASGEFKILKGDGESFSTDYGTTFDDIKSKMDNPQLEVAMLETARQYAKVNKYKEYFQAVKISERDWTIIRHELTGLPLRRTIAAHCLAKWPDGHCTTQEFVFGQEYDGVKYSNVTNFRLVKYGSRAQNLNCK